MVMGRHTHFDVSVVGTHEFLTYMCRLFALCISKTSRQCFKKMSRAYLVYFSLTCETIPNANLVVVCCVTRSPHTQHENKNVNCDHGLLLPRHLHHDSRRAHPRQPLWPMTHLRRPLWPMTEEYIMGHAQHVSDNRSGP